MDLSKPSALSKCNEYFHEIKLTNNNSLYFNQRKTCLCYMYIKSNYYLRYFFYIKK